jgi:hypothetical protein
MIPHHTNTCPVSPDTYVRLDLGDGQLTEPQLARHCAWGPGCGPDGEGRIHGYVVVGNASPVPTRSQVSEFAQ